MTAGVSPHLGVVVVNYGSHHLLEDNLARVDTAAVPASVVVVDNFHSLAARSRIRDLTRRQGWQLIERADNGGFGTANNDGVRALLSQGCTSVLLLNPDVEIDTATVRLLLEASTTDRDALIGPVVRRPDGSVWFSGGSLSMRDGTTRTRAGTVLTQHEGWLTGACLVLTGDLWRRTGGFDPDYFLYWEDVDLSRRCVQAGGHLVLRHELGVVHHVGGTQPGAGKSSGYLYYNTRNRLLFAAKHLDRAGLLRWLVTTPLSTWRVVTRDGRRSLLRRPGTVISAVRGSSAGAVHVLRALLRPRPRRAGRDDEG